MGALMNILITNDDGVCSNGLIELAKVLSKNNEVLVIAPNDNRSACSHAMTVGKEITLEKVDVGAGLNVYTTSGTPADCVKISKLLFKDFKSDVVVAGINKGHNLGSDILYSGTLSAACEGSFFGNVSFAFSSFELVDGDFNLLASYSEKIINLLYPISNKGDVWNINFPSFSTSEIKGIKITKFGKQLYSDRYEKIGINTYKLVGELINHNENDSDCDVEWIKKGYVTITPVLYDKTDYKRLEKLKELELNL